MNAGAVRDVAAKPSMVTPIASSMAEALLPIMQYIGIKRLEVRIEEAANLKKIFGDVTFFNGTPERMRHFSELIKDSLAEIIAASGLTRVEIEADQDEVAQLIESYDQLQAMYAAAKISSEDSMQLQSMAPINKEPKASKPVKTRKCACGKTGCKVK